MYGGSSNSCPTIGRVWAMSKTCRIDRSPGSSSLMLGAPNWTSRENRSFHKAIGAHARASER